MSEQQIRPKQLRTLLLLLVLVPLIPTALMIRFMADALKGDRLDALERMQERYSQLLEAAVDAAPQTESSPFALADFQKLPDLVVKLRSHSDPVSEHLWRLFPPQTQQALQDPGKTPQQQGLALIEALNQILRSGASIHDPDRFAQVRLSEETENLISQEPTGRGLIRLNRLLIEDAYPLEMAGSRRKKETPAQKAIRLYVYLSGFFDSRVSIRVIDGSGQRLAGEHSTWGQPIAQAAAPIGTEGLVQIFFSGPEVLDDAVAGPRLIYTWTGIITTLALLLITGTAAMAVRRQVALHELRSTSVATVAHELRTPLGAIRMLVDTLREGRYRGEKQIREYLDLIATENDRLSRLAENFLTFSRLDATRRADLSPLDPHVVVAQAVAYLQPRLDAPGCTFKLDVPESLPRILADRDSLSQVFINLLDNALKYTGAEKKIALRAHAEPAMVVFSVEDDGIGIPEGERKAIFEPFHQVDDRLSRTREGCGLGLAIARRIVSAHGGKIEVASRRENGSVFTVRIPRA